MEDGDGVVAALRLLFVPSALPGECFWGDEDAEEEAAPPPPPHPRPCPAPPLPVRCLLLSVVDGVVGLLTLLVVVLVLPWLVVLLLPWLVGGDRGGVDVEFAPREPFFSLIGATSGWCLSVFLLNHQECVATRKYVYSNFQKSLLAIYFFSACAVYYTRRHAPTVPHLQLVGSDPVAKGVREGEG